MITGKPDFLDRLAQGLLVIVALFCLGFGAFMIVAPGGWYEAVPNVSKTGPANFHFIRDVGVAFLASGVIIGWAAFNIHMRWLGALAGALWLLLHGFVHLGEAVVCCVTSAPIGQI